MRNLEERVEIYERACKTFTLSSQILAAIEELNELAAELARDLNGKTTIEKIISELADVEIMVEQMKLSYRVERAVEFVKDEKIDRLVKRLKYPAHRPALESKP